MIWEKELEKVARSIYNSTFTGMVSESMIKLMAQQLMAGIFKGYGKSFDDAGLAETDFNMLEFMESNVFVFCGMKNYSQLKEMSLLLKDTSGSIRSFNDFMGFVRQIDHTYSVAYAQAEYNHALNSSMMASKWQTIANEKSALPLLRYTAVMDDHTRAEHAALNNVTRKVDDDFWRLWMPPNGWNCRCDVVQLAVGTETDPNTISVPDNDKMWQNNVGINGVIFPAKHPYFAAAGKDRPRVETEAKRLVPKRTRKPSSRQKLSADIKDIFESNMPMKVSSVEISSELTDAQIIARNKQLKKLFKEYEVSRVYGDAYQPKVMYKSSASSFGFIESVNNSKYLHRVNFGHKVDKSRADMTGWKQRGKSRVDAKNLEVSTLTHEFAHVITTKRQTAWSYDQRVTDFWPELDGVFREYKSHLKSADENEFGKVYLGAYAGRNADEFFAESFTEYKLCSTPSPYAKRVGELADKYFKRHGSKQ